jgi:hypothetical protein
MIEATTVSPLIRARAIQFGREVRVADQKKNDIVLPAIPLKTSRSVVMRAKIATKDVIQLIEKIDYKLVQADIEGVIAETGHARYKRQAEIADLLRKIDKKVSDSAFEGISLLSRNSSSIRLRTTSLGGSILVSPLSLDIESIGLSKFRLQKNDFTAWTSADGGNVQSASPRVTSPPTTAQTGIISADQVINARLTIQNALARVNKILSRLEGLNNLLGSKEGFLTKINTAKLNIDIRSLPRGVLINVVG